MPLEVYKIMREEGSFRRLTTMPTAVSSKDDSIPSTTVVLADEADRLLVCSRSWLPDNQDVARTALQQSLSMFRSLNPRFFKKKVKRLKK